MEIISYLDDREITYSNTRAFNRKSEKSFAYNIGSYDFTLENDSLSNNFLQAISKLKNYSEKINLFFAKYFKGIFFITLLASIGIFISFAIINIFSYSQSIAKPLTLQYMSPQEIEVLDSAMEKFALVLSDEIDSNGNLLENHQPITINDINLREPVTFKTYSVGKGDTISGITRKFGLTNISTLIGINDIGNVRHIKVGQTLTIPSIDGLTYVVQPNDTIAGLSVRYKIPVEDILDTNDLSSSTLLEGQKLFIPGAKLDSAYLRKAMGELFTYPLSGKWRLTSKFGKRRDPITGVPSSHTGIDLAIAEGTPIKAAMSGKVLAIGFTNVYGNYIILDHENGYQTLYAHMQKPSPLKKGQNVNQGMKIGQVGNTGYSTGPHLHFTVYKNGKLIDPHSVLK